MKAWLAIPVLVLCLAGTCPVIAGQNPPPDKTASSQDAEAQRKALEDDVARTREQVEDAAKNLERVDKSVGHLEQSVLIMLAVATLMVAILLGTTYYGEKRLLGTVKELQDEAEKVKARFPKLANMEDQARQALENLEATFGSAGMEEWLEDRYAKFDIADRQRILLTEHLIALDSIGESTSPQLRGMANFYFSKYKSERIASDLDRSLYYALQAAQRSHNRFEYLNDLGCVYIWLAERDSAFQEKAIQQLNKSRDRQQAQQRCYYNLGVVFFSKAMAMRGSVSRDQYIAQLREIESLHVLALSNPNWESRPSPTLASLIDYNQACCLCRLAEAYNASRTEQEEMLDEAMQHLEKAARFKQTKFDTLRGDLTNADGDLKILAGNTFYKERVAAVVEAFQAG